MKIELIRLGVLEDILPSASSIEYLGPASVKDFLEFMDRQHSPGILKKMLDGGNLKSTLTILLNGRSIRAYPKGMETDLKNGDTMTITLMMDGG